ncbi:MAG: hypothetical protein OWU33_15360 [Firmicutes bacterium]|nr:hypothetical protein [Bacillota bacterium]
MVNPIQGVFDPRIIRRPDGPFIEYAAPNNVRLLSIRMVSSNEMGVRWLEQENRAATVRIAIPGFAITDASLTDVSGTPVASIPVNDDDSLTVPIGANEIVSIVFRLLAKRT